MKAKVKDYFGSNWAPLYEHYLRDELRPRSNGEALVHCPFHNDHRASLAINLKTGQWHCFGCGKSGDAFSFVQSSYGVTFTEAVDRIAQDFGLNGGEPEVQDNRHHRETIPFEVVEELHQSLLDNSKALRALGEKRGLTLETVQRFKLGYLEDRKRLATPVFDARGRCVNVRLYSSSQEPKMVSWGKGYGEARLYPGLSLDHNPIWIMEGELDALLALQDGINAISATCGAGTWRDKWNKSFESKDVVIAYDHDNAGRRGAAKVAHALDRVAKSVFVLEWPQDFEEGGDYTDWRVKHGRSVTDFLTLPRRPLMAFEKPEVSTTTALPEAKPLTFPEEGYIGLAADFAELYSAFLESPKSFFYMAFLTYLGVLVADKVTLDSELRPQPRLYTVLIGESASTRKSTALRMTDQFFRETVADFAVQFGIGSAEGLAEELKERPSLILHLDELKSFVEKAKIKASVALPLVNTLFERNEFDNRTKTSSIRIRDAYLALIGACTEDTYGAMFDRDFFAIGFLNRLFLVLDRSERKQSLPCAVSDEAKLELSRRLGRLLSDVDAAFQFNDSKPVRMKLTAEAREAFQDWYMQLEDSVFARRLDTYAHRLMILLALSSSKVTEVDEDIVTRTTAILDYELEVRRECDPVDAENKIAAMEEKIRRALARGPLGKRDLMRKVHYDRYGTWVFDRAMEGLARHNEVAHDAKNGVYALREGD